MPQNPSQFSDLDMLSINLHISDVVLEHCGDVDL